MLRASWASLMARKLRLFMSAAAVILGVAFVAGSFIFTDTLGDSFTALTKSSAGDVVIRAKGGSGAESASTTPVPASVVASARTAAGAARADGNVTDYSTFVVSKQNKVIGGAGAPGIAVNHTGGPAAHGVEQSSLTKGRWPTGAGEVTLDETTASKSGYLLGETVRFISAGAEPTFEAKLVGTHTMVGGSMLGASVSVFDTATTQRLFQKGADQFTDVWVTATSGTTQEALRAEVAKTLPSGFEAVTGDKLSAEMASEIQKGMSFITTFLLVFAAVSLIVGTFLIINTFSILVAQRSRELALFRAIGASRGQVSRSVLFEAFVIGLIGSTAGLFLGFGLAMLIRSLFGQFGLDMSGSTLVLAPRTVLAAYAVGLVVTMVAAYVPARRAGQVAPVAAMRDDVAMREGGMGRRLAVGLVLAVAGGAAMFVGLKVVHSDELKWIGAGMLGVLIGVALISPVVGRPLITGLGWLYRKTFGVVGTMATQNSLRNPRRTAATASALMIGVALVTLMSIFGASAKASVDKAVKSDLTADYVVSNAIGQPISPAVAEQVATVDGVKAVAAVRWTSMMRGTERVSVQGVDPAALTTMAKVKTTSGSFTDVVPGTLSVFKDEAKTRGIEVGDSVEFSFQGTAKTFTVAAIHDKAAMVVTPYVMTLTDLKAMGAPDQDSMIYVLREPGTKASTVLAALEKSVADLPTVTVKDQAAFAAEQRKPIDQMLTIIYALLGLAVLIAILGIVNTLGLSVIERTKEIGLLRAVGLGRRQLRSMLRLESIVIAVLGATLGVVLGLGFGVAIQRALASDGFNVLLIPWQQLGFFLALAVLVGVLASVWPGRRAAKIDILRAVTTE